ncbi:MAG: DEAD/DEAH box helicase [Polyangiales bacterium]
MSVDVSALREMELSLDEALSALDAAEGALEDASAKVARLERPCIRLFTERLLVNRGDVLRPDFRELDAPVIELTFEYPGFTVSSGSHQRSFGGLGFSSFARDQPAETRARHVLESFGAIDLDLLEDYGNAPGSRAHYLVQTDETRDGYCSFTAYALPQLRELGFKVMIDADYPYDVLPSEPPWYAEVGESEQPDWFNLELGIEIDGHRVNLLPVLLGMLEDGVNVHEHRHGWQSTRFVAVPGHSQHVPVPPERLKVLMQVMAELYQGSAEDGSRLAFPAVRAAALGHLEQAFDDDRSRLHLEGPSALCERARNAVTMPPTAAVQPRGLQAQLRPYQQEGVAFLQHLREQDAGGVLADDMGLGKTLQTIAHLCIESESGRAEHPTLIIAPTSLVGNWERELAKFAPGLTVCVLHGRERFARREAADDAEIWITTYPLLLRDVEFFHERAFHYVILDEAQTIKNHRSRAHEAVRKLASAHRLCLTGTPIENGLEELWSLFDFLMPGLLGDELAFRQFYRVPIEQHRDSGRLAALRAQVSPYVLRRLKRDVAKELPDKTEIVRAVELRGKQRELYESIRVAAHADVRSAIRKSGVAGSTLKILEALMKLRQLCCDPRLVKSQAAQFVRESAKYDLFFELLEGLLEGGHRVLVFSQFTSMLALLSRGLRERSIQHLILTGQSQNRQKLVDEFERGAADVFLISLKAGGTGLNLVSADAVIHYDPWWNPAAQDQATDRAYRIGQKRPVFVYNLVIAGSVEERMLGLQQRKRELAQSVLSQPTAAGPVLGECDVEQLFAPLPESSPS